MYDERGVLSENWIGMVNRSEGGGGGRSRGIETKGNYAISPRAAGSSASFMYDLLARLPHTLSNVAAVPVGEMTERARNQRTKNSGVDQGGV